MRYARDSDDESIVEFPSNLDIDDFEELVYDTEKLYVKTKNPWFIKFYAPWCRHCQDLSKTWDQLYEDNKKTLHFAKVDCTIEKNGVLCAQFNVKGYPTLILLKEDKYYQFKGARNYQMLTDFAVHRGHVFAEKQGSIPSKIDIDQNLEDDEGFWAKCAKGVNKMFETMGLEIVPKWLRYTFIIFCITSPFWIVALMVLFDDFDKEEI